MNEAQPIRVLVLKNSGVEKFRALMRLLYSIAVLFGCAYLVFWRGESGWLFALAILLLKFRNAL